MNLSIILLGIIIFSSIPLSYGQWIEDDDRVIIFIGDEKTTFPKSNHIFDWFNIERIYDLLFLDWERRN